MFFKNKPKHFIYQMFIDASKEERYTNDGKHPPSVILSGDESNVCSKVGDSKERTALELEFEGRLRGLDAHVKELKTRARTNNESVEYRTEDLRMLQMVTTVLRLVYYLILTVGLVLYAYERWFEYYEDKAHDEALLFIVIGTALIVGPRYLLEAIIYIYGVYVDMTADGN